jgi:hypothetical protein
MYADGDVVPRPGAMARRLHVICTLSFDQSADPLAHLPACRQRIQDAM